MFTKSILLPKSTITSFPFHGNQFKWPFKFAYELFIHAWRSIMFSNFNPTAWWQFVNGL